MLKFACISLSLFFSGCAINDYHNSKITSGEAPFNPQHFHTKMKIKKIDDVVFIEAPTKSFFSNEQYSALSPDGATQFQSFLDYLYKNETLTMDVSVSSCLNLHPDFLQYVIDSQIEQFQHLEKQNHKKQITYQSKGGNDKKCYVSNFFCNCNLITFSFKEIKGR